MHTTRSVFKAITLPVLACASLFLLHACADTIAPPQEQVEFTPPVAETPLASDGTTPVEPVEIVGDAAVGRQLFLGTAGNISPSCSSCHTLTSDTLVGPGMAGLYDRAGSRVPGQSADEYITQSIREPGEFITEGFTNAMPAFGADQIDEQDLADLLAFFEEMGATAAISVGGG